ncbi:hypothetical protein E2C01_102084 [Portunus trituberculatus]|uniref:Uncharacterized protein n=1 Tax=Portunus trituberculatus TaxID=210409 RepID=A0A5B7KGF5_PORTR|nr:hypothetical protein [Portunus trituberculatus]
MSKMGYFGVFLRFMHQTQNCSQNISICLRN